MESRPLGTSGIQCSVVGLGTWAIGGWMWGGTLEKESVEAIRASIDNGVTLIDAAPAYGFGLAEKLVGRAIEGRRDEVVVATKCGLTWNPATHEEEWASGRNPMHKNLKPESIKREVEASLKRLSTDRIDLLQTHWPDMKTPIEKTMGTLLELKKEGKIRAIGVSNVNPHEMDAYRKIGALDSDQERYSMIDRKCDLTNLPYCRKHGLAFLAYSPLAMGLLTGKLGPDREFKGDDVRRLDERFNEENRARVVEMLERLQPVADSHKASLAQLALAWTAAQPGVTHVLVGARNAAQALENAGAGSVQLSAADLGLINAIVDEYRYDIPPMSW